MHAAFFGQLVGSDESGIVDGQNGPDLLIQLPGIPGYAVRPGPSGYLSGDQPVTLIAMTYRIPHLPPRISMYSVGVEVYRHPRYYEIAFSYRDIAAEVDFIEEAIARFSQVRVRRLLEFASGNSPHTPELCRRGYECTGLEISPEMIAWSRDRIRAEGISGAGIVHGDMRDFALQSKVECVLVFLGSLYVRNNEELREHLGCVARAIVPGGLYILDGVVRNNPESTEKQQWIQTIDGITVSTTWEPQIGQDTLTLDIDDHGKRERIQHTE